MLSAFCILVALFLQSESRVSSWDWLRPPAKSFQCADMPAGESDPSFDDDDRRPEGHTRTAAARRGRSGSRSRSPSRDRYKHRRKRKHSPSKSSKLHSTYKKRKNKRERSPSPTSSDSNSSDSSRSSSSDSSRSRTRRKKKRQHAGMNQPYLVAEMVYKSHKEPTMLGKTVWRAGTTRQLLLDVALGRIKNDPSLLASFENDQLELRLIELSVLVDGQQQPPQLVRDDDCLLANFLDLQQQYQTGKIFKLELSMIPLLTNYGSPQPSHHVVQRNRMHPTAFKHSMDPARQLGLGIHCQQQAHSQQQGQVKQQQQQGRQQNQGEQQQQGQEHWQQQQLGGTTGIVRDGLSGVAPAAAAAAAGGTTPENATGYKAAAPDDQMDSQQHQAAATNLQQKQQRRAAQQNQQQPSLVLLQAEFDSAFAAADVRFQQAADSSEASRSYRLADDDLLRDLERALQNYKDGTSGNAVDVAQHAAAAAATDRTAASPAEKQREAAAGAAEVPVLPRLSLGIKSPRCGTANAQTAPAGAAPSAVQAPPASTAGAAAAAMQSSVACTLQQIFPPGASCPATAAARERQPQHAPHSPAPAVAGSGAAASSSYRRQDSKLCLHSCGRQASTRAAMASPGQINVELEAAKQTRLRPQCSRQQQLESTIQTHVLQLSSSETGLQTAAAVSLRLLAHKDKHNSSCIVAAGAVQPLVALLDSTDSGCQAAAAYTLLNLLSLGNTTRKAVLLAGGIPLLVTMLTSSSSRCQIAAADLLKQLARIEDGAAAVLSIAGSFDAAVTLLRSTDQEVVAAGLHLLIKLLSNGGAQGPSAGDAKMLQAAAATVVGLLDSWGSMALEAAAIIADSHPHIKALQAAIPTVAALLGSNSSSTRGTLAHRRAVVQNAARFLYHMACDGSNLDVIAADGLKALVKCIQPPTVLCVEDMQFALGAVYRVINGHPQRQQAAVAAGVVGATVQLLLDSNDTNALQDSLAILWCIAETSSTVQSELQSRQAVSRVVELLGHSDTRLQHSAAGLLMVLVKSSANIKAEAVEAGAISPLIQLIVNSNDPSVLEDVIEAVGSLAMGNVTIQAALAAEAGAITRLQDLVSSDNSNVERAQQLSCSCWRGVVNADEAG